MKINYNNTRHLSIHKQQFNSIEEYADYIILDCIEDGRKIVFKRENRLSTMMEDEDGE